jgi:hypothetical protein
MPELTPLKLAVPPGPPVQPTALGMVRWRPAPFRQTSPFQFEKAGARARSLGQAASGIALFDHPIMALALNGSAAVVAAFGAAKFEGWLRALSFGVLIGAGAQALVSAIRFLNTPSPAYPAGGQR